MIEKYKFMSRVLFTALWIQLCWGFVCSDILPALEPTRNYINLLLDGVYLMLGIATIRERRDLLILGSFVLIAGISAYLNHQGIVVFFNGTRDFIGLLFAAPVIRYFLGSQDAERFVKSFDKMFYVFLWLQVPCLVSQFIRFGAGDAGGGTLGVGGSGMVSTLIYIVSFYLINKRWDEESSYINNLWRNRDLVFLIFPTFLNETKISLIFFALYFVLLLRVDRKFIVRIIIALPFGIALFLGGAYLYMSSSGVDSDHFDAAYFNDYLLGDDIDQLLELAELVQDEVVETDNLWVVDLPRYGRFVAVPEILNSATGGGLMFGAGLGQFKGGSVVSASGFASKYQWFLQGSSIMFFFIVIQLGLVGLVWMIYTIFSILFTPDKYPRAGNLKLYMFMVLLLVLMYNDSMRNFFICVIMFYIYMRGLQPDVDESNELPRKTTELSR